MKHPLSLQGLAKSIVIRSVLASALLCVTLPSLATETTQLTTIIDAKPIDRVVPKYPRRAARMGREGWAKISFVIEKDGSVSNPLIEDTVGYKGFGAKAIQAIKKWKFQPAIENGKPVQQCQNSVVMSFVMTPIGEDGAGIVSNKFYRIYTHAIKAIKANDLMLVKEKIDKIDDLKVWKIADASYANLLKANYQKLLGNKKEELKYLYKAISQYTKTFPEDTYFDVLQQIYALNIEFNRISAAYSTLHSLMKMKQAQPHMSVFKDHKTKLDAYITSDKDIIVEGDLNSKFAWQHTLLRHSFSLLKESGNIRELDVRCANKRHKFSVGEDTTWNIPKKWKKCTVYVFGDKETKFKLVEHAKSAKQQTTASL